MTRTELLAISKPILFNTEMVRAILDGRKTVTRRVVKTHYRKDEYGFQVITRRSGEFVRVEKTDENECGIFADGTERHVTQPFYIDDIIYVRETWNVGTDLFGEFPQYIYKAEFAEKDLENSKWKPSIHMPKEAARIFLRITDVRVERLQDITIDGVEHEGIPLTFPIVKMIDSEHLKKFIDLWNSTIKPADVDKYSWDANPWVWVYEFERVKFKKEELT